jgi:hypothetical protein
MIEEQRLSDAVENQKLRPDPPCEVRLGLLESRQVAQVHLVCGTPCMPAPRAVIRVSSSRNIQRHGKMPTGRDK